MSSLLKVVALIVVVIATVFALQNWVVGPYECNLKVRRGTTRLLAAVAQPPGSYRAVRLARATIEDLQPCVEARPSDISADMVLAGSYRMIGELQRARETYEMALAYDRRPELYFNLGQVEVDAGNSQAGIQNFITACLYDPAYFDEISKEQPEVRDAVRTYLVAHSRRADSR